MALVDIESDTYTWEKEFESANKLHIDLLGILGERDQLPKNSQAYGKLSYQLRQNQNQLLSETQSLKAHLERLSDRKQLTFREKERRNLLIEDLISKHRQIQETIKISSIAVRNDLLSGNQMYAATQVPSTSSGMDEYVQPEEMKQIQAKVLAEQDKGLETLSEIIRRQKQMAHAIGDEVESQNDIIDNIADHVDLTRDQMARQTTQINLVERKDRTCGYWVVIISLFLAIVILASIPKM